MIDPDGYRPNVGIVLVNPAGQVLWARRLGQQAWQFPQGGIKAHETPEQALFREISEELGLRETDVKVMGATRGWLRYTLPKRYVRKNCTPVCIGQKQVWFLLRLIGTESAVRLDTARSPEFDHWKWVNYWYPAREVIFFKRDVYRRALKELAPLLYARDEAPPRVGENPNPVASCPGPPRCSHHQSIRTRAHANHTNRATFASMSLRRRCTNSPPAPRRRCSPHRLRPSRDQ